MSDHFLRQVKDGFFVRRLVAFLGDDQNVLKKGDQIQSLFPWDQMFRVILSVIAWKMS
jgi:hypothetical protein